MSRFSLALDSTQITDLLACPYRWNLAYREHLIHKFQKKEAFDWGTIMHALLEAFYLKLKNGSRRDIAMNNALTLFDEARKSVRTIISAEDKRFIEQRFIAYTIQRTPHDITPLEVEKGFSIPILDNENFLFVLEGRIDMIGQLENGTKLWMDHKTQDRKYDLYDHSIQFKNYSLATGLGYGMVNYIGWQDTITKDTFRRQLVHFSPLTLQLWRERLITIFMGAAANILGNTFPLNESACHQKWGICEFSEVCPSVEPHSKIREGLVKINYMKREPWLPWHLEKKS